MDYRVELPEFHGPLDLLLYLVKKNEVDVRDIPIAALALAGPPAALPWAVGGRVASDVGDALVLGASTKGSIRTKVLAVTLGWAALNALAYAADTRRR